MCFLRVEINTKKDTPLTYQFLKYYALFGMYLKVSASHGLQHRNLARKITQASATVVWQPKYFVQIPTASGLQRQTACPFPSFGYSLATKHVTSSFFSPFFSKDNPIILSQPYNF